MRSFLLVHMGLGVSEGGIRESTKEVCRNLIKSMPRWIQAVIKAKEPQPSESTKTGSLSVGHCKSCIKSIKEANNLKLGTDRDRIPCFVT